MANNRIYYAIQQVAIKSDGASVFFPIKGLQSVGMTTNFNLSQVFEMGQISIYENIEEIPDVQMTLNKVLDGYPPIFCLSTMKTSTPTLVNRGNQKCSAHLSVFDESSTSALGTPVTQCEMSGLYTNTIRYNFPRDGNFTEEITLVGNDKLWKSDSRIVNTADSSRAGAISMSGAFVGTDSPASAAGVSRRQDILFLTASGGTDVNGAVTDPDVTILPPEVAGIGSNGVNTLTAVSRAHINSISVSTNLNREAINELGKRAPYFRNPTYPVEVTTEIEITATSGDLISSTESGIFSNSAGGCGSDSGNLKDRTIRIATCDGLRLYCGLKNKLSSVNYGGGDAGGGHVAVSYTFTNFNDFTVMHSGEATLGSYAGVSNSLGITNCTGFWSTGKYTYLVN